MSNNQGGTVLVIEKCFSGVGNEIGRGWSLSKRATLLSAGSTIIIYTSITDFAFLF
jgi:hypothetical protein